MEFLLPVKGRLAPKYQKPLCHAELGSASHKTLKQVQGDKERNNTEIPQHRVQGDNII